jgi:hypothetical protein
VHQQPEVPCQSLCWSSRHVSNVARRCGVPDPYRCCVSIRLSPIHAGALPGFQTLAGRQLPKEEHSEFLCRLWGIVTARPSSGAAPLPLGLFAPLCILTTSTQSQMLNSTMARSSCAPLEPSHSLSGDLERGADSSGDHWPLCADEHEDIAGHVRRTRLV